MKQYENHSAEPQKSGAGIAQLVEHLICKVGSTGAESGGFAGVLPDLLPSYPTSYDIALLRNKFTADPETGKIFHRHGRIAFASKSGTGYLYGGYRGKVIPAHRVMWALVHGRWPSEIDHLNGVRDDNRLCNLREVTRQENTKNKARSRNNSSGVTGVDYSQGKWRAKLARRHLGYFATLDEAVAARKAAEAAHDYHPNHGRAV
jgi:hypothetical protein